VSIEPKMEDLLASIRKAIDSDVGSEASSTVGEARGKLMRGALREMRVNLNETRARNRDTAEEIAELRGRILRNAKDVPPIPAPPRRPARPALEPQRQAPPPSRSDFKAIMAGQGKRPRPALPPSRALPPPPLQEDPGPPPALRGRSLQDEFDELTYNDQGQAWPESEAPAYPDDPRYQEPAYAEPPYVEPTAYYAETPQPQHAPPPLLSHRAEAATDAAFRHLSESLFAQGMGGRSLEDVTRELLRGMLKQWLDDNLPPLVERLVREEIARVARSGR
jgi:cell pole-organizing protein PopZ